MKDIFRNWTLMRWVRLIAGLLIGGYGMSTIDWPLSLVGAAMTAMAVLNTGCGPFGSSCAVEPKKKASE